MKSSVRIVLLLIPVLFAGCGSKMEMTQPQLISIEQNNGAVPYAGIWRSDTYSWIIKIDPNGSISKMQHFVAGKVDMASGGTTYTGPENAFALYMMGPAKAFYNPSKRELSVRIVMDYYRMEMPIGTIEGSMIDYLLGTISEDGTTWNVNWLNYSTLEGGDKTKTNELVPEKLRFLKVGPSEVD